MRRILLIGGALMLVLTAVGVAVSPSQAATPDVARTTLTFDVEFSPFTLIATNNDRDPTAPISVGDEIVFHDHLFVHGTRVGDDAGSCVILEPGPDYLSNCTIVFRLPAGNLS